MHRLLECPITTRVRKTCHGSCNFNDTQQLRVSTACGGGGGGGAFAPKSDFSLLFGRVPYPGANSSDGQLVLLASDVSMAAMCEASCATTSACDGYSWVSSAYHEAPWRGYCYGALSQAAAAAGHADTGVVSGVCVRRGFTPCDDAVASADLCFDAAVRLPALANASMETATLNNGSAPPGCSVAMDSVTNSMAPTGAFRGSNDVLRGRIVFNTNASSTACCGISPQSEVVGVARALGGAVRLGLRVDGTAGLVTMSLSGPQNVWFAVGLGAQQMVDAPYAIVVEGGPMGAASVSERRLAKYAAGTLLAPSVTVLNASVAGGMRTVVLRRPIMGATLQHFSFDPTAISLDFIAASGQAAKFILRKLLRTEGA